MGEAQCVLATMSGEKEDDMIALLRRKWGRSVFRNQRREHEVSMFASVRSPQPRIFITLNSWYY